MQVIFLMHVAVWKNGIATPKKKCFTGFCAVKPKNHMFCYNVVLSVLTRWVVIYIIILDIIGLHGFFYTCLEICWLRFFMWIIWESTKLNIDDNYDLPFKVLKKITLDIFVELETAFLKESRVRFLIMF